MYLLFVHVSSPYNFSISGRCNEEDGDVLTFRARFISVQFQYIWKM